MASIGGMEMTMAGESWHRTSAMFLCVLLAAFAVLHAYWALGGGWGLATAIGPDTPRPDSGPIWATAVVQGLFAFAAYVVARSIGDPPLVARGALWVLAAGSALVAVLNMVRGTRAAERYGIASLALLITVLALFAVRRTRAARSMQTPAA
jgi:hypothetical protein